MPHIKKINQSHHRRDFLSFQYKPYVYYIRQAMLSMMLVAAPFASAATTLQSWDDLNIFMGQSGSGEKTLTGNIVGTSSDSPLMVNNGGPFTVNGGGFTIKADTMTSVKAGGAIQNTRPNVTFNVDMTFVGNKSTSSSTGGGAMYNKGTLTFGQTVTFGGDSITQGNKATNKSGGALYNNKDGSSYKGIITFEQQATFKNNEAKVDGGGLYNYRGSVEFEQGAIFSGNATQGKGGAICSDADGTGDLLNATVIQLNGESAFTNNKAVGLGGAIYNTGVLNINANTTFSGNKSDMTYSAVNGTYFDGKANDIYNLGKVNIVSGTTTMDGGIISGASALVHIANGATVSLTAGTTNIAALENKGNLQLGGGTGELTMTDNNSIVLSGGTYTFNNLTKGTLSITGGQGTISNEVASPLQVLITGGQLTANTIAKTNTSVITLNGGKLSTTFNQIFNDNHSLYGNVTFTQGVLQLTGDNPLDNYIDVATTAALEPITVEMNHSKYLITHEFNNRTFTLANLDIYKKNGDLTISNGSNITVNKIIYESGESAQLNLIIDQSTFNAAVENAMAMTVKNGGHSNGNLKANEITVTGEDSSINGQVVANALTVSEKASATLTGTSQLGQLQQNTATTITNNGDLSITGAATSKIKGTFVNTNQLTVANNVELDISGYFKNQGNLTISGAVDASSATDAINNLTGTITVTETGTSHGSLYGDVNGGNVVANGGEINGKLTVDFLTTTQNSIVYLKDQSNISASTGVTNNGEMILNGTVTAQSWNNVATMRLQGATVNGAIINQQALLVSTDMGGGNSNVLNAALTGDGQLELSIVTGLGDTTLTFASGSTNKQQKVITHSSSTQKSVINIINDTIFETDNLSMDANSRINVGDATSKGTLIASNVALNGATIFSDPSVYTDIDGASAVNLNFVSGIDGTVYTGINAVTGIGDNVESQLAVNWAKSTFRIWAATAARAWSETDISAALAITSPQILKSSGSLVVDGSNATPATANNVTFANKSMLMVAASTNLETQAALTSESNATANISNSSVLVVSNAVDGKTYKILQGFNNATTDQVELASGAWQGDNLVSTDALIELTLMAYDLGTANAGEVLVTARRNDVSSALPEVMPIKNVTKMWEDGLNDVNSDNAGIAFISQAADSTYLPHEDAAKVINGAAQIAVAAGVQAATVQAATTTVDAIEQHVSLANNVNQSGALALHKQGADLWVNLLYADGDSSGLTAAGFDRADYSNHYAGLVIGSDYTFQAGEGQAYRIGGALSLGDGDTTSRGDFEHTKNDYDTWGLTLYGGWNSQDANVLLNVSYMKQDNAVDQHSRLGKLSANFDSEVLSASVKGEYRISTSLVDFIPHLGVRYLRMKTDGFDTKMQKGTAFKTSSDTYNIWQFPLGLTLTKAVTKWSNWTVKPMVDVSIIPSAGNKDAQTTVYVPGVMERDRASSDMLDSLTLKTTFGLEVQNDNHSFGVRGHYQKGSDTRSRGVMGTYQYQFK